MNVLRTLLAAVFVWTSAGNAAGVFAAVANESKPGYVLWAVKPLIAG